MPHAKSRSWDLNELSAAATSWYKTGGAKGRNYVDDPASHGKGGGPRRLSLKDNRVQARTRSIPAITDPQHYSPAPYSKPPTKKPRPQSFSGRMEGPMKTGLPPQLWLLPSLPGSTYNPKNELQRRVSPTALSFSSSVTATPPLTPITPTSAVSSTSTREEYQTSAPSSASKDPKYVLTLRTSDEIARQMNMLRERWFPADRLKVPAHITLFHALPGSRIAQLSQHIEQLAARMTCFEISTGRVTKTGSGVFVGLEVGEHEARRIFVSLRTSWWEWLSDQDKSFRPHWTVQNKEADLAKIENAFKDTHRLGTALGWATGLVLWTYEADGRWTKEREFGFVQRARERDGSRSESESDGWPVY
ncbi:uncharacterized protein PV09_06196 [Verruconis gallopava]|uniref:Uncharacterized protein n=1 Tax=Verruconis gallopava TaxID=253628 RepID=A0A0D2ATA0_9PEZI|nr:uncharacterized protein PV09_06196 [Verruconis gallopava]KIW02374.1 hypothetical protein PV09_06196 [Verruconis gallopava]